MTALVVCCFSRRRLLRAPGSCETLRAVIVRDRLRAERQGLVCEPDPRTASMVCVCELAPGWQRDLAFELGKTDDFAGSFKVLMETVEATPR